MNSPHFDRHILYELCVHFIKHNDTYRTYSRWPKVPVSHRCFVSSEEEWAADSREFLSLLEYKNKEHRLLYRKFKKIVNAARRNTYVHQSVSKEEGICCELRRRSKLGISNRVPSSMLLQH